jgi:hypothetical protein
VIKNPRGARQTVELDDTVGGLADIKAGDKVILTLRDEPGRPKVSAVVSSKDQLEVQARATPKATLAAAAAAVGPRSTRAWSRPRRR